MASEAQRIMNLSLNKIVSSRGRKGGISLHRNLLVASVLFKARDVYASEMAGLVVIRNGFVYDRSSSSSFVADDEDAKPEVGDEMNEETTTTDDNLICDEQIKETVNSLLIIPSSVQSSSPQSNKTHVELSETVDSNGDDKESCKENIEPSDSVHEITDGINKSVIKSKRPRKLLNKQCRKRKFTEVEQAVLSITEQVDCSSSEKKACIESAASMDCTEILPSLPDCTHSESDEKTYQQMDYRSMSCISISPDAYSSSDSESSYRDVSSSFPSSYHNDYCTSSSNDAIAFSLLQPMLVVSV